ncbi:hypothetical protein K435DRAFT_866116 [Dendrothele bispora CBS 962.96]|uniref:Uncharacterized protein n=1 Tax=Dendrothele bispora (strain CBS 962.96) TaxID=1314807 RepID=A0A4S8LHP7_DENBC|nr:hypothetical protein K435DRAFT_866116 [Dendrothele bispora CBS 962.96]
MTPPETTSKQDEPAHWKGGGFFGRALLSFAYSVAFLCLLRIDELLHMQTQDVRLIVTNGRVTLHITLRWRKTDQEGDLKTFIFTELPEEDKHLCVVRNYRHWIAINGRHILDPGPLFPKFAGTVPDPKKGALSPSEFLDMFRHNLIECKINDLPYGTHSFRRGGCQYLSGFNLSSSFNPNASSRCAAFSLRFQPFLSIQIYSPLRSKATNKVIELAYALRGESVCGSTKYVVPSPGLTGPSVGPSSGPGSGSGSGLSLGGVEAADKKQHKESSTERLKYILEEPSLRSLFRGTQTEIQHHLRLVGQSHAIANTSIGQLTLDPIKFNVSSPLNGLQGLKNFSNVDVNGGTTEGITLGIDVAIHNPSNLNLTVGDLRVQLLRNGKMIGTALMPNLTLIMGDNKVKASLKDVQLSIAGYDGSTKIALLVSAFETLNIDVTLPWLKTSLLDTATLTVLSTTGRENNISHVAVSLANPFYTDLNIKRIQSTVSAFGIQLRSIDSSTSFKTQANPTTTSPDLNMNLDPSSIFTVTRALAVEAGLGTSWMGSDNIFTGFDLPSSVSEKKRSCSLNRMWSRRLRLGLFPVLAHPIVQKIFGGSNLGISQLLITDPQQEHSGTRLNGSITNAGPFDAKIAFPESATVQWSGQPLGNIKMEDIDVTGDVGAQFSVNSQFQVMDVGHLTDFTKTLLTQESFQWDIFANNLNVSAIGIMVDGITLTPKTVSLKGFNGLKNGVKVETFSLPSMTVVLHVTYKLPRPTVELSRLAFDTFAQNVMIAPVATTDTIMLAPESSTSMSLKDRLVPQSSDESLSVMSDIFNRFIHGQDSDVSVHGSGVGPSDVIWLNGGIKSFQIDTGFAQLAIPKGPSTTDVDTRFIHLGFNNVPFAVSDGQQETFNQFLAATTMNKSQTLGLSVSADADANTAVGLLGLKDISSSVQSTIAGLDALDEKPVTVSDLDVNHGFPDFLSIKVNTALFDPSNLTVGSGDVSLTLQYHLLSSIKYTNAVIGEADLSDMVIKPGNQTYPTDVHYAPQGAAVSAGRALLENFLQGVDVDTTISGSTDSIPIESLKAALTQIVLSPVTIPALHQSLIIAVSITFPEDIVQTGMAQTSFTLANSFTASINLLKVSASAIFHNLTLGTIDNVDVSSNPIHVDGHSNVTSPSLPLKFDLDPATTSILAIWRASSRSYSRTLTPFRGTRSRQFSQTRRLPYGFVLCSVDQNALFLIGAVAGPVQVAEPLVDQSKPKFDAANITFVVALFTGNILMTRNIANDGFVCAAVDDGVPNYSTNAHLMIINIDQCIHSICGLLLHNEDFTWTISTDKLRVTALRTIFENVSLKKDVSFKAFNGLSGVTISNFQLPSDDPAGGIHIETNSRIPSAQLGIDMGTVTFTSKFKGTTLGRPSPRTEYRKTQPRIPFRQFRLSEWIRALLHVTSRDLESYPQCTAGISFTNPNVHGYKFDEPPKGRSETFYWIFLGQSLKNGEKLVVLSSLGNGCTTLLKTLLKTISGEMHGFCVDEGAKINYRGAFHVTINALHWYSSCFVYIGIPWEVMHKDFPCGVVYNVETDVHFPNLTVRQTLSFAAKAHTLRRRLPGVTREQFAEHMKAVVMALFGLSHTGNTKVGNDFIRGVSGGERKRSLLNIPRGGTVLPTLTERQPDPHQHNHHHVPEYASPIPTVHFSKFCFRWRDTRIRELPPISPPSQAGPSTQESYRFPYLTTLLLIPYHTDTSLQTFSLK